VKTSSFFSKSLNKIEKNYEIHDKEILAIIKGLEVWRHLLEGAQFKFEIWMDYKNLEYFIKIQKLNRRQARLSRSLTVDFIFYFLFSLYFIFSFYFFFYFLFLEQLGLEFISHAVTSVTKLMV